MVMADVRNSSPTDGNCMARLVACQAPSLNTPMLKKFRFRGIVAGILRVTRAVAGNSRTCGGKHSSQRWQPWSNHALPNTLTCPLWNPNTAAPSATKSVSGFATI